MRFTTQLGQTIDFDEGILSGDPFLVEYVKEYIEAGNPAGCDYWAEIEPSLETVWQAYLTICGALLALFGVEPSVDPVPENPDGYESEGPVDLTD